MDRGGAERGMGAALEGIGTENLGFQRFSLTTWVNPVWAKKEKKS